MSAIVKLVHIGAKAIGFLLSLVIWKPIQLIAKGWEWAWLRKLRYKPRIASVVAYALLIVSMIALYIAFPHMAPMVQQMRWDVLVLLYSAAILLSGILYGDRRIYQTVAYLQKNPQELENPNSKWYQFEFRLQDPITLIERNRNVKRLLNGAFITETHTPMGLNQQTLVVTSRTVGEAGKHTLAFGASGSGKTIAMLQAIYADIVNLVSMVIIDFKASPRFASTIANMCKMVGVNFYHIIGIEEGQYRIQHSDGIATYDTFANTSKESIVNRIMNLREYDVAADHYRGNDEAFISTFIGGLFKAEQVRQVFMRTLDGISDESQIKGTLLSAKHLLGTQNGVDWDRGRWGQVVSALSDEGLDEIVNWLTIGHRHKELNVDYEILALLSRISKKTPAQGETRASQDEVSAWKGLRTRMRPFLNSRMGVWLVPQEGHEHVELLTKLNEPGNVILFSFNSDAEPEFSSDMSTLVVQDITAMLSERRDVAGSQRASFYADEIQRLGNLSVLNSFLEKARDAKMSGYFALQSAFSIIAEIGRDRLNAWIDIISNVYIHAGIKGESAAMIAEIIGKEMRQKYRFSYREHEEASWDTERVLDYIISPPMVYGLKESSADVDLIKNGKPDPRDWTPREVYEIASSEFIMYKLSNSDDRSPDKGKSSVEIVRMIPCLDVLYHGEIEESMNQQDSIDGIQLEFTTSSTVEADVYDMEYADTAFEDEGLDPTLDPRSDAFVPSHLRDEVGAYEDDMDEDDNFSWGDAPVRE